MADPTGDAATETVETTHTPADATSDRQPAETETRTETVQEDEFDRERAMRTIKTLREEARKAAAAIRELDQARARIKEIDDAKLSEQERLSKRASDLEKQLEDERAQSRTRINTYEVQLAAGRLGIVDPDAAVRLLDWSSLEYGQDGRPVDVESALQDLVKARPYLAAQATPAHVSPTNPATRGSAPGQRVYTQAELADYTFYTTHREDIQRAFREGRIR